MEQPIIQYDNTPCPLLEDHGDDRTFTILYKDQKIIVYKYKRMDDSYSYVSQEMMDELIDSWFMKYDDELMFELYEQTLHFKVKSDMTAIIKMDRKIRDEEMPVDLWTLGKHCQTLEKYIQENIE